MALDGATSRGAAVTVTTADAFIPELWADEILKAREKKLVMVDKIMHVRPLGLKYGDTVHIPRFSNLTALDKTAESAITYATNTESKVTININKHKYIAAMIEDIADIQSKYDLFSNHRDKIAYGLADVVDSDILALTSAIAQSVGTHAATSILKAHLLTANRMLDAALVPAEGRYLVVDAYGREDLLNIDDFVRYDAGGKAPTALKTGEIGEIYGVKVLFSQNIAAPTATSAYGMMFHGDAFAIAMQKDVTMKTEYSVDYLADKVAGYELYGVTWARTDHAVLVRYTQS